MTSWLIAQSLPLSVLLIALLAAQKLLKPHTGPTARYAIWLCLPVYLVTDALLPNTLVDFVPASYTVTTQTLGASESAGLQLDLYLFVWLTGALSLAVFHGIRYQRFVNKLALSSVAEPIDGWSGQTRQSAKAASPFVMGMFHPTLVVPKDFKDRYTPEQQNLIINHESTHVQHGDPLWNGVAHMLVLVFWFNPLMWVAYRQFRALQEEACDQTVMANATRQQRVSYAHALVQCATQTSLPLNTLFFGDKKMMENRVVGALEAKPQKMTGLFFSTMLACLVGLTLSAVTVAKEMGGDKSVHPLTRVEPKYPIKAAEQKIEGSVTLRYDIETDGSVSNVSVVSATPENVFNRTSITALEQWTYAAPPHKYEGVLVQLDFVLDEPGANAAIKRYDGKNEMILVEKH